MTFHEETARRGSTFNSRRSKTNPRELLISMIEADPGADKDILFSRFLSAVREDDEYLDPVVRYFFINVYQQLDSAKRRAQKSPQQREAEAKQQDEAVQQIVTAATEIIILNQEMPNGKRLRNCTGRECAKFGGFYGRIAKKVGPTKRVGEVLDEKQVRALLR